jgi:predicted membrane-bound dolichyl-phosphate-mannose-protein mannosyltransferase
VYFTEGATLKNLSEKILPPITAGIRPEYFPADFFLNKKIPVIFLCVFLLSGFGLRVWNLGTESLGEDEFNKLQTVAEYREKGLTGRNGEHPFLMKGLQTISLSVIDKLNLQISDEAALRFPTALFGTFTALLIFLLFNELFGSSIALIAAALWAVDPNAVGFDRIAKEDSFLLFFFLLANYFWIRGQTKSERGENHTKYIWLTALACGAMLASKYLPHLIMVCIAYFSIIRAVPGTRWRIGKTRWLVFYILVGTAFLIFNPTVLLPETWQQMLAFSKEQKIAHDAYEFAGTLYQNKMTLWTAGVPWYFYYFFILFKTPVLTLIFALAGLPFLLKRKIGDGRIFLLLWLVFWFLPFTFLGGKFTRYFTSAEPIILILAAIGCFISAKWISEKLFAKDNKFRLIFIWSLPAILILVSLINSLSAAPHYRLFTNGLAGNSQTRFYFPHDEFYDTSTRETVLEIAKRARPNAVVAVETPTLFEYYAQKAGREDLIFISLSDKTKVANLSTDDFIIYTKGRRYFSNENYLDYLENSVKPVAEIKIGEITSVKVYQLDEISATRIREFSAQ